MKLTRFHQGERIVPGVFLDAETILDCSALGYDWNEEFFGADGLSILETWLREEGESHPKVKRSEVRLAPAIARPSKIICIGLNYAGHAAETNAQVPQEPILFFKSTTAWCGPDDPVEIPLGSEKTDWEVELAIVIGKRAKRVSKEDALDYVAGYALHNDYSERSWQLERGGQWAKGKSADTFAPFGPFLADKQEIADPNQLRLWLKVNGEILQDSNTSDFIFNVQAVVSYLSEFMTLLPGDVISTGTPAGVGLGLKPPRFLKPGDVVELGIDGLGAQRQVAIAEGAV